MSLMSGRALPEKQQREKSRGRPFSGRQEVAARLLEVRGKGDPLWLTVLASKKR